MKKIIGIDLGITSVGWAVINENLEILDQGVRLFEESKPSNNVDRRIHRGQRRLKRRKAQRIIDLKILLRNEGIISSGFKNLDNPYQLREKGLTQKLSNEELATALLHIAKRRGSCLETIEEENVKNEDSPKVILSKNDESLEKYEYISLVQLERLKNDHKIRGTHNVFRLEDYIKEVHQILKQQKIDQHVQQKIIDIISRKRSYERGPGSLESPSKYGAHREISFKDKQTMLPYIKEHYHDIYGKNQFEFSVDDISYTALKNGRIVNSEPYSLVDLMRGRCSIYNEELRAPKNSFSAELHDFLNDLNNLTIPKRDNPKLTKEEKEEIISIIFENGDFKPKGVKGLAKYLKVDIEDIKGLREKYSGNKVTYLITEFKGYKAIKKAVNNDKKLLDNKNKLDVIAEILSTTQDIETRQDRLLQVVDKQYVERLSECTGFTQFHAFSYKALYELNKELLDTTMNQQQIIIKNKMKPEITQIDFLEIQEDVLNPVVKRAHREALKVIAALTKEFDDIDKIVIETTRSKNSDDERKNLRDQQAYYKKSKIEAEQLVTNSGYNDMQLSNQVINKIKLYQEQNGKCAYTGTPLSIDQIIRDHKSYEIDHIIPYSISLDNSQNNKVLVIPSANQIKGNQTPFGYFKSGKIASHAMIKDWHEFKLSVEMNSNYSKKKKENLLLEKTLTKFDDMEQFIARNLNDTSYAVRVFMNHLKSYYKFNHMPIKVVTVKGKQTSHYRGLAVREWNKHHQTIGTDLVNPMVKNRDQYMHHAIDALIIAGLSQQKLIQAMQDKKREKIVDSITGEVSFVDPSQDSDFIKYLRKISEIESSNVKFSWKIDTKPNRKFSDETIYSTRMINNKEFKVSKEKDIYTLESNKIQKILIDQKDNLLVYRYDIKTYEKLLSVYLQYKHEKYPYQTYKEQYGYITKYAKKNNGPQIKQLKRLDGTISYPLDISHKYTTKKKRVILTGLKAYRVDIYQNKKGRYRFVTIRFSDVKPKGKYAYINQDEYKAKLEEKKVDQTYAFKFSLYRNNIVKITKETKGTIEKELYRFIAIKSDKTNVLEFKYIHKNTEANNRITPTIGPSIKKIEKYNVSVTGKYNKIDSEQLNLKVHL